MGYVSFIEISLCSSRTLAESRSPIAFFPRFATHNSQLTSLSRCSPITYLEQPRSTSASYLVLFRWSAGSTGRPIITFTGIPEGSSTSSPRGYLSRIIIPFLNCGIGFETYLRLAFSFYVVPGRDSRWPSFRYVMINHFFGADFGSLSWHMHPIISRYEPRSRNSE